MNGSSTVGSYEAKTHLPRLLQRVALGETITITRHGKPVAVLAPPLEREPAKVDQIFDDFRDLRRQVKPDPEGWTIKQYLALGRP